MLADNVPVVKPMMKGKIPEELQNLLDNPELMRIIFQDFSDTEVRRFCISSKKILEFCKRDIILKKCIILTLNIEFCWINPH
jgi:hypothetical protein